MESRARGTPPNSIGGVWTPPPDEDEGDRAQGGYGRRRFVKDAAAFGVAAAATAYGYTRRGGFLIAVPGSVPGQGPVPASGAGGINGIYDVVFATSGATSSWHNDMADQPMRVSDFRGPGSGAMGKIPELAFNLIVVYLQADTAAAGMKGIVAPGFVAFNARCTHVSCTSLWRDEQETKKLVPASGAHDYVVCPCHLGTFDPYDSAKVVFGPPPTPLDQLKVRLDSGQIQIEFTAYVYGGSTPQV